MRYVPVFLLVLITCSSIYGQSIQWSHLLLPGDVNLVAKDSSEKTLSVFKSRLFIYDSLQVVSKETGQPFFEHTYYAEFKKPQEINHIIVNLKSASRLMYAIRLFDEQNEPHTVYNYGAIRPCDPEISTLLLTIAHTPYKVKRIELGTFQREEDKIKVGISGEVDGNKVAQELVSLRIISMCNKASYFTDKLPLGNEINSVSFEVKPVISPDGKTLYFHRQNHKDNTGGKKDDQDIFLSRFVKNEWTAAENIQAPLNDEMPNGVASVSSGETSLFLINEYLAPNQQKQGLSYSEKTINGWSFPKKINVKNFYNRSEYIDYFISPTQNEMILAVQRDDSFGDQDLYVSFFDDVTSSWTEPQHLGAEVNSMLSETSPFLAADGKTLYFASNGFLGYGGFDIFVTRRLDDSWTNWSFPENLGPVINTFDDDLYYTLSAAGDNAYFVSTLNDDRNIYRIALPTIYKPEPVVLLSGKVFNQSTLKPEEAEIKIRWHNDDEVIGTEKSDPVTGEYKVILPVEGIFHYTISKDGFESASGIVSTLKTKTYEEKTKHLTLRPHSTVLDSIVSIPLDTTTSRTQWESAIADAATFLVAFPDVPINVSLNDSVARSASDFELIRSILVKSGVAPHRISRLHTPDSVTTLLLKLESTEVKENVAVPDSYEKPLRLENTDVSLMVKGKAIDAVTFKPVAGRLVFKNSDKVRSRSLSDPVTGNFQTLIPANTKFDIALFTDSSQYQVNYESPNVSQYQEISMICLINDDKVKSSTVELGSWVSSNADEKELARRSQYLKRKKAAKELLRLKDDASPLADRFEKDLGYLAEALLGLPDAKATITLHTSSGNVDGEIQKAILERIRNQILKQGIDDSRITTINAGASKPKHKKKKHFSNNRLVAEVFY